MEILGRILRFLFWLLVLSWGIKLLKRLFSAQFSGTTSPDRSQSIPEVPAGKRLVRDPVCGMHVAEELTVSIQAGSETVHFCSAECKDRFLRETRKLAANA